MVDILVRMQSYALRCLDGEYSSCTRLARLVLAMTKLQRVDATCAILALLYKYNSMDRKSIMLLIGKGDWAVSNALKKLEKLGYVEKIDAKPSRWRLTEKGKKYAEQCASILGVEDLE